MMAGKKAIAKVRKGESSKAMAGVVDAVEAGGVPEPSYPVYNNTTLASAQASRPSGTRTWRCRYRRGSAATLNSPTS